MRSRNKSKKLSHSASNCDLTKPKDQTPKLPELKQEPTTSKTATSTLSTSLVTYDSSDTDNDS